MTSLRSVLVFAVCLALAGNVPAAPHSGTSSSFKSGFSSQKSKSAHSKPAPPPASRQSGPGAFGKQAGSPASSQPRNTSAMSRDVDQSAARANALKSLEARRAADAAPPPLPPLNEPLRQPQPAYRTPPAAPVYQQPSGMGNAWMHGLFGYMLGRAMTPSAPPAPTMSSGSGQPAQSPTQAPGAQGDYAVAGMPGLGAQTAPSAPPPSFAASVLRWFIWLGVLSLFVWAAVYAVRKLRRLRGTPTYSFERN